MKQKHEASTSGRYQQTIDELNVQLQMVANIYQILTLFQKEKLISELRQSYKALQTTLDQTQDRKNKLETENHFLSQQATKLTELELKLQATETLARGLEEKLKQSTKGYVSKGCGHNFSEKQLHIQNLYLTEEIKTCKEQNAELTLQLKSLREKTTDINTGEMSETFLMKSSWKFQESTKKSSISQR